MVVSHRESSISSNIRAIIEQLNLNPVERRRLIDRTKDETVRCKSFQGVQPSVPKITIGVYGCKDKLDYEIPGAIRSSCKIEDSIRSRVKLAEARQRQIAVVPQRVVSIKKEPIRTGRRIEVTKPAKENVERPIPPVKEDLPQFESASLNHTAALHRISVRPRNRRPPRRSAPPPSNASTSTITTIVEDALDGLDQQKSISNVVSSSPIESKTGPSVVRKSSARVTRSSDIFEGVESSANQQQQQPQQPRLPRKPSSTVSLSPDSLDATSASRTSVDTNEEQVEVRSVTRRPSNRISKGSDIFEELEAKLPRRRSSSSRLSKSPDSLETGSCWFSKSTEGFDKLVEYEEAKPVAKRLLKPISKSSDRVSKSSDSLEAIEALTSDDSIERRRSSFEFRARRPSKSMSKSSESFDMLNQSPTATEMIVQELQKRSSISDMNLSRGRRLSKSTSKSSDSFERVEISESKGVELEEEDEEEEEREPEVEEEEEKSRRRSSKRMSSESSDNLDMEDRLENRRVRRVPKRVPSTSIVDIVPMDDNEEEKRSTPVRKSRLQKSSESSELGSTDTLDSERRNKSSESTETLDSLDKDVEQDRKEEEMMDNVVDRREKNDSWSSRSMTTTDSDQTSMADGTEDSKSLISPDKFYWRQSSDSKENIDIHQLLAITIVTRMADNGNNQRSPVIYPKKKQQMASSPPTSPVAKQEDNKMIFDNLLTSKNDEDLQNMLNGNISEVSTDTKSFKEKLIMFEKLGK
ncbi:hypothetical protein KPH14_002392 [Odynerus spinipes]|uniref:Uncharacterized protein n=1 Tax=Odynerus spinipes TaxID=1348599 RepID=A0AAD9VPH6_9HYME|nr:hypothetical protein KPH14_002392 [Odynerus spinipes]